MISRGIDSTVIAVLMGDESSTITERCYIDLFDRQRTDEQCADAGMWLVLAVLCVAVLSAGVIDRCWGRVSVLEVLDQGLALPVGEFCQPFRVADSLARE